MEFIQQTRKQKLSPKGRARKIAKEAKEKYFKWDCLEHGKTEHYTANKRCVICQRENAMERARVIAASRPKPAKVKTRAEQETVTLIGGWQI